MSTEQNESKAGTPSPERLGSVSCPCIVDLSKYGCRASCVHNRVGIQDIVELETILQSGGLLKPNTKGEAPK